MSRSVPEPAQAPADERADATAALGASFRHAFRSLRSLRGRDTHLVPGEVGYAQFELLLELFERGPLSMRELASVSGLRPATISPMLDHLAGIGFVVRERSEADQRVVMTKLTPRGTSLVEARKALWRARWDAAFADVDPADLQVASRVLDRIGRVFDEAP